MYWEYKEKSTKQLKSWYNSKVRQGKSDFLSVEDFLVWYNSQKKECLYCKITEREYQEIIHKGILSSNRFPENGVFSRGRNRGYWLEIDRKKPKENYSKNNSVLCCYFCNNDKSDVFTDEQYFKFMNDRTGFIRNLFK
jgi:hypothetical protein